MKMGVLYLKALGYPHQEIAKILDITETTARSYDKEYVGGSIEALQLKWQLLSGYSRHHKLGVPGTPTH
jgi:predicted transcriptional regulator